MSVMVPSVVTTMPMDAWSSMTFRVPSSAASVMGMGASDQGVETIRGLPSSEAPTAPSTI